MHIDLSPVEFGPYGWYIKTRDQLAKEQSLSPELNKISGAIIDAAVHVHKCLGPGLLESVYEACLEYELTNRGLKVRRQVSYAVKYESVTLKEAFRLDLVVENSVVVELKAVARPNPVHISQVLTYLKLSGYKLGILLCFNNSLMKHGIKRIVL